MRPVLKIRLKTDYRRDDRRCSARRGAARLLGGALAIALLSGCAQTKNWLDQFTRSSAQSSENVILGAPGAWDYLADLERLAVGDPATQAEIFADADSRATLTPDTSTTLKLALVLATPGHAESDEQRAQSMLRDLLAQPELMTAAETALAQIHLRAVEDRLVLLSEARRLRESVSRQALTEEQAMNRRLAIVESENRELRSQLEDARSKLDAITTIERSIREQD